MARMQAPRTRTSRCTCAPATITSRFGKRATRNTPRGSTWWPARRCICTPSCSADFRSAKLTGLCHNRSMWIVGLLLLAFAQQAPEVLFRQKEALGWTVLGEGSELHGSGGAMVFSYDVVPKKFSGAVIGAPQGFERMRSIRFAIKTDHDTAIGVLLSEKKPGGGNYAAWFWAPANLRQQIELTPADFSVTDGPGDPVDADG